MAYRGDLSPSENFRQFIKELQDENDLISITKEVDPHLELAAITRKVYETEERAPLFENISGRTKTGLCRVLGAPVGLSRISGQRFGRIAKSFGLQSKSTGQEIIQHLNKAKGYQPIPPKEVSTGPVKEHKLFGDDIDLTSLPIPLLHQDDGEKYMQTFGMFIVQTPDGNWINWSITRGMINDKQSLVCPIIPKQDIGVIFQMWKDKSEDMPFALCFGVPPAAIMVGGMPIPKGTNEGGYVGALIGKPIEVVQCETNGIHVPAHAEFVLEGKASISKTAIEGPMAEYHGMIYPGQSKQWPVFEIEAITYRDNPILPICVAGRAAEENHTVWSLMQAAEVLNICQNAGLPIQMAWCPFESHCLWFALQVDRQKLIALNTNMAEFSNKLGHVVFSSKPGWYIPKIFLVGDDIDPTNLRDVIWAEATRCQPGKNEFFFHEYGNLPLIPYVSHGIKPEGNHAKVVRCCMFPYEFTDENVFWKEGSKR
ncbi:hypothetical protein N7456_002268 [Penicillium angulare]|uniref:Ferulic acid decarboxylase 1 n=1 Tax=Penicillium angulare TaxID=116970 RepID=A0A9W9G849_9EURO|nr:hypothetical protein N7456_002268 [Penicillium angulare]